MLSRCVLLGLLLTTAAARLQADEPSPEALLDEATRLFAQEADYDGALARFRASYDRQPTWRALNGIALVYQQQSRWLDALETYQRLNHEFGPTLNPRQAHTVDERIEEMRARLAVLLVDAPERAELSLDGHAIQANQPVMLLPGPHQVVAAAPGFVTWTHALVLEAGRTVHLSAALEPERTRVEIVVKKPVMRLERRFRPWVPWVTLAGGTCALVVGAGLLGGAAADFSAFDSRVADQAGTPPMQVPVDPSRETQGQMKQSFSYAFFAVGGALVATTGLLLLINRPRLVVENP